MFNFEPSLDSSELEQVERIRAANKRKKEKRDSRSSYFQFSETSIEANDDIDDENDCQRYLEMIQREEAIKKINNQRIENEPLRLIERISCSIRVHQEYCTNCKNDKIFVEPDLVICVRRIIAKLSEQDKTQDLIIGDLKVDCDRQIIDWVTKSYWFVKQRKRLYGESDGWTPDDYKTARNTMKESKKFNGQAKMTSTPILDTPPVTPLTRTPCTPLTSLILKTRSLSQTTPKKVTFCATRTEKFFNENGLDKEMYVSSAYNVKSNSWIKRKGQPRTRSNSSDLDDSTSLYD